MTLTFNHNLKNRANQTHIWCPSDSEENWKPLNDGQPNYSKTEIEYKFNSDGFRSDEFSDDADISILFMGCSFTEGIGLLVDQTWPTMIIEKIKSIPGNENKKIPLFSIAIGASGLDTQSRYLYEQIDKIKPTYIIYLLSSFYRREFSYGNLHNIIWVPAYPPIFPQVQNLKLDRLFTDDAYAFHQSYMAMALIQSVAQKYHSEIVLGYLQYEGITASDVCDHFPKIQYTTLKGYYYYDSTKSPSAFLPTVYATALSKPLFARDNLHRGMQWQYSVAHEIWDMIHKFFEPTLNKQLEVQIPTLSVKPISLTRTPETAVLKETQATTLNSKPELAEDTGTTSLDQPETPAKMLKAVKWVGNQIIDK